MDDEPLKDWAERRDAKTGKLRAAPVTGEGSVRGSHVSPDAPRVIERWNGSSWEFHAIAPNLAEAKRLLCPEASAPEPSPAPNTLGPGTGKHRKPQAPRSDRH
ncbi:DUF6087 family protein [Streptomyces sp. NPDC058603]|uniref:DUF6087 family protein n=1 Tax=Streptomyces sp. NPDC058603 TaxID=3346551 RepID=UPI003661E2B9